MNETDYATIHKAIFRKIFNTLNSLWPPENTVEYWGKAIPAVTAIMDEFHDNPLARGLAFALCDYLEKEGKKLQGEL